MEQLGSLKTKQKANINWNILYGHHTYRSVAGYGNAELIFENFKCVISWKN